MQLTDLTTYSSEPDDLFEHSLFLPGWWVDAYGRSIQKSYVQKNLSLSIQEGGLLPRYSIDQLNSFAILLHEIQREILNSQNPLVVEINLHSLSKKITGLSHRKRHEAEFLFQIFGATKLIDPRSKKSMTLFDSIDWQIAESGAILRISISPENLGLIFGFVDAYKDVRYGFAGLSSVKPFFGKTSLLCLAKSAWLELKTLEQALYFNMEVAHQLKMNWVDIVGSVGSDMQSLFSNLLKTDYQIKSTGGDLALFVRTMNRLTRRLSEQGVLTRPDHGGSYLAYEQNQLKSDSQLIAWSVKGDMYLENRLDTYVKNVHQKQSLAEGWEGMELLLEMFAGHIASETLKEHAELLTQESLAKYIYLLKSVDGMIAINILLLASEVIIRQIPGHSLPIGRNFVDLNFISHCRSITVLKNPEKLVEMYHAEKDDLQKWFLKDSFYGLRQANDVHWRRFIKVVETPRVNLELKSKSPSKKSMPVESSRPVATNVEASSESLTPKIARKTLIDLRSRNQKKFQKIKIDYIESLDRSSRDLVCEIQNQMQSNMFDEHITERLVSFIVAHPEYIAGLDRTSSPKSKRNLQQ